MRIPSLLVGSGFSAHRFICHLVNIVNSSGIHYSNFAFNIDLLYAFVYKTLLLIFTVKGVRF